MESSVENISESLFRKAFNRDVEKIEPLKISGSARMYFRLSGCGEKAILCLSQNIKENKTFIGLSEFLKAKSINVPAIYTISPDFSAYLEEDLGDTDLLCLLAHGEEKQKRRLIEESLVQLVKFQTLPRNEWNGLVEFPPLDSELIRYDFNYAVTNFFDALDITYNKEELENEFKILETILLDFPKSLWGLMFRDFQSRNIMVRECPYLIDFQSSRYGPGIYDVVSFAWQAKAGFTPEERNEILRLYAMELEKVKNKEEFNIVEKLEGEVKYWAAFRILQTLGAYGLRGLKEGKRHFIESIPFAVGNLNDLMWAHEMDREFPVLAKLVFEIKTRGIIDKIGATIK